MKRSGCTPTHDRYIVLALLLASGKTLTTRLIRERFGVSRATAKRDLLRLETGYAERDAKRFAAGKVLWGVGSERRTFADKHWEAPEKWAKTMPTKLGRRPRVFCASMGDWLDLDAPIIEFVRLLDSIRKTPELDWLLLSKRIGNWRKRLEAAIDEMSATPAGHAALIDWTQDWLDGEAPANVWAMATVVTQEEADRDIVKLIEVPARVHGLSIEPMLDAVNVMKWLQPYTCADCGYHGSVDDCGPDGCEKCGEEVAFEGRETCKACGADDQAARASCPNCGSHRSYEEDAGFIWSSEARLIDWVICGGESGLHARPLHPDWVRSLRDQCAAAGVPFHFKQWGEYLLDESTAGTVPVPGPFEHKGTFRRLGTKAAGRLLDGVEHNGFPA